MLANISLFVITILGFLFLFVEKTDAKHDIPFNDDMGVRRSYPGLKIRVPFTEVNVDRGPSEFISTKALNVDVGPFFRFARHDGGTVIRIPFLQNLFSLEPPNRSDLATA